MPLWQPANAIARPAYYDRNPLPVIRSYINNVAPFPNAQLAVYTVPAGRAGWIEVAFLSLIRTAAPTTLGLTQLYFLYSLSGGTNTRLTTLTFSNGTVNTSVMNTDTAYGYMQAGDTLSINGAIGDLAGAQTITAAFKGMEFDK